MKIKELYNACKLLDEYGNEETCFGRFPKWKDRHIIKVINRLVDEIDRELNEKIKAKVFREEIKNGK